MPPPLRILTGDALTQLGTLPDESVHCVVTSPPYWGLRDYGTKPLVFGGDPSCKHRWGAPLPPRPGPGNKPGDYSTSSLTNPKRQNEMKRGKDSGSVCRKCGAWRGQLGLEPTVDLYVEHMVDVFREVRRVLRVDGTAWVNLGDCYAAGGCGARDKERWPKQSRNDHRVEHSHRRPAPGLKPKDLVGQPWMLAFALRADGWWLRGDNIWHKLNPMPESVKDRPTKAHEYVFLLTKSGTPQYWAHPTRGGCRKKPRPDYRWTDRETGVVVAKPPKDWKTDELPDGRKRWSRTNLWRAWDYFYDQEAVREASARPDLVGRSKRNIGSAIKAAGRSGVVVGNLRNDNDRFGVQYCNPAGRNLRSVWTIPTQAFPSAHFATFPEALVTPCIRAGTSAKGCCEKCGAPWVRVVERSGGTTGKSWVDHKADGQAGMSQKKPGFSPKGYHRQTTGWHPTCTCGGTPVPCTVLDPFGGAGTTALVALKLERHAILIELNPEYAEMARARCSVDIQTSLLEP